VSQGADIECDVHRVDPKSDYCPENCILIPRTAHRTYHSNALREATRIKRDALKKAANTKREARREAARVKRELRQVNVDRIKKETREARREAARVKRELRQVNVDRIKKETRIRNRFSKFLLCSKITVDELFIALGIPQFAWDAYMKHNPPQLLTGSHAPSVDYSI
jgi:hypothetical protein